MKCQHGDCIVIPSERYAHTGHCHKHQPTKQGRSLVKLDTWKQALRRSDGQSLIQVATEIESPELLRGFIRDKEFVPVDALVEAAWHLDGPLCEIVCIELGKRGHDPYETLTFCNTANVRRSIRNPQVSLNELGGYEAIMSSPARVRIFAMWDQLTEPQKQPLMLPILLPEHVVEDWQTTQSVRPYLKSQLTTRIRFLGKRAFCESCGTNTGPFTGDHLVPVALGGRANRHNLRIMCHDCNNLKADYFDPEWISEIQEDPTWCPNVPEWEQNV